MPLTFPSHAGVVVPLKLWRPRWFDGVALVLGSTAPDLPYAIHRYAEIRAHTWWGLVWFCVPVTMLGCVAVRWAVAVTAAHLPMGGPLRLRDYGGLRDVRHPLLVTAFSAWLGALSHRLWDVVTHASIDQGTVRIPALGTEAVAGQPWWRVLFYGSTVAGAAAVLAAMVHIGRRRLLVRWHGPAPAVPTDPAWFWGTVALAWIAGSVPQPFLRGVTDPQVIVVRLLIVAALGLLAGTAAVRARRPATLERAPGGHH